MPTTTVTTTTPVPTSRSDMGATVATCRPHLHPKHPLSRRIRLARDLALGQSALDKGLYGEAAWNIRYAAVIESDLRAGDHEAIAQWIAPADAALSGSEVLSLMDAFTVYDAADVEEDAEQVALNRKCAEMMSDLELDAYAKSVARELYAGTRCLAAIRAVQRDRRLSR